MHTKITLGVIIMIALVGAIIATTMLQVSWAVVHTEPWAKANAPVAITGDNVYVAWWTNQSGNEEVMFRASNDKGQTFGDKINLSNTTYADSTRVEIDSDTNSVVVTWWETNKTSDTPVMKVSNDFGKTFGPMLKLAGNGTIASGEVKPVL
jgi:hypothetical protein